MFGNKFRLILGIMAVIVLLAVVLFLINKKSAAEKNRDEISIVLSNIAANAQTHYKRANSFSAWVIPGSLRIEEVGTFRGKVESERVLVYVVGKEIGENGVSNVNIKSIITVNNTTLTVRN